MLAGLVHANGQAEQPVLLLHKQANGYDLTVQGVGANTYFYQHSLDMTTWHFLPYMDVGVASGNLTMHCEISGATKSYFRLKYTNAPGNDFDNDGVQNRAEVETHGTHPFESDSDHDGLTDHWEITHLFPPNSPASPDGNGDADGDGLNNLQESALGTDPRNIDSDADGAGDGYESDFNTDALSPDQYPPMMRYVTRYGDANNDGEDHYIRYSGYGIAGSIQKDWPAPRNLSGLGALLINPPSSGPAVPALSVTPPFDATRRQTMESRFFGAYAFYGSGYSSAHSYSTIMDRCWLEQKPAPVGTAVSRTFVHRVHTTVDGSEQTTFTPVTFTIPANTAQSHSEYHDLAPALVDMDPAILMLAMSQSLQADLIPVEVAPDLLQVNADFDEAQINTNTGRPQPDCDNNTLIAYKKLPWTSQVLGNAVFDELHEGWFGVSPSTLEPSFYSGASVKIAKIIQTDPDTGANESGHVRLWITAGSGTALQEWKVGPYDRTAPAFTPTELVGLVYGPTATIPTSGSGKRYWIEGIKAGKCTLEFTYTRGATNFKHRQTFEVGCEWTPTQWKEVVRQHVYIESDHSRGGPGADMAGLDIALGFMPNRDRCRAVYQYYGSLFLDRPDEFHWLGLAKRAGASVYWGFSDSQYVIETWPTSVIPATVQTATSFQQALLRGMRDIFDDIGWQFMAYHVAGVKEMGFLNETGAIQDDYLTAWNQMTEGYGQNQPGLVDDASLGIARQEQEFVLLPSFTAVSTITTWGVPLDWILSIFSVNPVPGGLSFFQFNPNGNITDFNDRWPWIENPWSGMLLKWKQQGILGRPPLVQPYIEFIAEGLSINWGFGYPIK